ncbi:helix-turn-helix domain-containing protein [Salipaludibacillus aurantiacus]|uniref:GAF domain-containing protein n=1 Tax=Salipaludibacillus aurantiacus TaxID=1601833 RepID=A0A1H9UB40_9BACI|nr:helix-turn-helix domain-containing protein [Salipaludibacillus aurantiacus]SES06374.1 GAF domain-containing protein [Salipaludibacillus aurantiacus]
MDTEKKLMSLISSARVMSSTLDLDEVLHQLIKEVMTVIEGANASILFLYDKKHNYLYPKAAVGFDMTYLRHARLAPGEGMSGSTFSAGKGQIFHTQNETKQKMANISEEAKQFHMKALGDNKYPTSALCVPLISKGEKIGVLMIDIYDKHYQFGEGHLKLLETFAAQAAIAIENATLFSRNERTNKIHEELSKVAISQGGISEITKSLGELMQHGVAVFNEFFDLLEGSSSQTVEEAEEMRRYLGDAAHEKVDGQTTSTVRIPLDHTDIEAVFFPVKSDTYTIGYLAILVHDGADLDPLDRFAVEQTSIIFALEMARQERTALNDLKHSGYLLDQLLFSEWNELAVNQIVKLPEFNSSDVSYVIAQLSIVNPMLSVKHLTAEKNRLLRLVYRGVSNYHYKTFVLDRNLDTTFMMTVPNNISEDTLYKDIKKMYEGMIEHSLKGLDLNIAIGIGRPVSSVQEVRTSHRDAKKCIEYIRKHPQEGNILSFHQLGIQRLLLNTEWSELEDYVKDTVGPLITYDKETNARLLETLHTYLESNNNMSMTAKKMFVHVNTIKYRLQQMTDLLNMEQISGARAFELQLGIYIYHYLNKD